MQFTMKQFSLCNSSASAGPRPRQLAAVHSQRCPAPFTSHRQQQQQRISSAASAAALPSSSSAASQQQPDASQSPPTLACLDRRSLFATAAAAAAAAAALPFLSPSPASAFTSAPPGFRAQVDKLDGYTFIYPDSWIVVTSSGNDIFLRNPRNIDENLFVDMSSPSSSRYDTVSDLGTPEEAATKILDQYLTREFMSTRIGIRREGKVLSATTRTGADGREYFDLAIRMTSYGSLNPYVATNDEVMSSYGVEWDRVLLTTLGVANKRLYELRFQTSQQTYDASKPLADKIAASFVVKEVDATPSVQLPASLRAF